jgi:mannitol/fructose-specific phosphotransferase system IIA component (Ntr-type)
MSLSDLLHPDLISMDLASTGKMEVLTELGKILSRSRKGLSAKSITKALAERERLASTGVGEGVAVPHAKLQSFTDHKVAVGISQKGIDFDAVDDQSVRIFFALVAPFNSSGEHLRLLAQIARLLKSPDVRAGLTEAETAEEIIAIIRREEAKH